MISDMARLYLLDTNILSHLVRKPQGLVAVRIADVGEENVLTSIVVACELRYGAAKRIEIAHATGGGGAWRDDGHAV